MMAPMKRIAVLVLTVAALGLLTARVASAGGSDATVTTSTGVVTHGGIDTTKYTVGWLLRCDYSHSLSDDPIVHPGMPGMSHRHDFYGNASTDANSTYSSMEAAGTTCGTAADTAGYWSPSLYVNGTLVRPDTTSQQIYYRNRYPAGTTVETIPADLRVVLGNAHATSAADNPALQGSDPAIYWLCGSGDTHYGSPPSCSGGVIELNAQFPSCWDGTLTHADDTAHLYYAPSDKACPAAFPHPLPRISLKVKYNVGTDGSKVTLASGPAYTIHADFFNTWQPTGLQYLMDRCINAHVSCGTNPIAPMG